MNASLPLRLVAALIFAFAVTGASVARAGDDHGGGKGGGAESSDDGGNDDGGSDDGGGDDSGRGSSGSGGGGGAFSDEDEDDDHDLARDLVSRGKIRPLNDIVRALAVKVPGRVVGVRLAESGGRWVYAFRLVTPEGIRVKVEVDAATMAIRKAGR
jgi:hypothetical protein